MHFWSKLKVHVYLIAISATNFDVSSHSSVNWSRYTCAYAHDSPSSSTSLLHHVLQNCPRHPPNLGTLWTPTVFLYSQISRPPPPKLKIFTHRQISSVHLSFCLSSEIFWNLRIDYTFAKSNTNAEIKNGTTCVYLKETKVVRFFACPALSY